uniref:Lysosomal proton-coupled steroid conjugate and bile acid symporter SLC46A3 n=1 Tax=Varanus komodoensis TaxID=61221 RepID=A0A8D2JGI6_VARKO
MKNFIVEPVICIYMFVSSMETPLVQQYIYRRLWEETTNTTFIDNDTISHCELNQSNPAFLKQQEVQEKASLFSMKKELCSAILSILMAFILVANGDRCGRKWSLSLPLVGSLLGSTFLGFMSYFSLYLPLLFALSFVTGLFGGMATFLGGAFSYVVDLSENERQKTVRIAVVDLIFGLLSGLGGVASGYILKRIGFTWTFATASLLQVVNIVYVTCCLDETVKISGCQPHSLREGIKDTFSGVWLLFKLSSCRKRATIILLLCVFMTYLFTMFGGFSLYTLYELNAPLCWNAVYIGYGSAVSTSVSLTGFLGLLLLYRCLGDACLVCIGIISYVGGAVMAAFANTTLLMFLGEFCTGPMPCRSYLLLFI